MHTTADDEIVRQTETPEAFQKSAQLFFAADKLRYQGQDESAAERAYREAMAATTTSGVFYHLAQGQIYAMRRNIEYALTEFEIASEINDQLDCVFINLGLTYRKLAGHLRSLNLTEKAAEMTQESLAALNRAVEINQENAGAWSALAMTYVKMGNAHYDDADRCVARARALDSDSYLALTTLASLRRFQGKKEEARQLALEAIALRPQLADAYGILGARDNKTRQLEDKPRNSMRWLEQALERQPNNSYLLSEMAKAHRDLENYAEAVVCADKAVKAEETGEQRYGLLAQRGDAYRLAKQYEAAEADLRHALAIRSDFTFAIGSLMKLCRDLGRHEEALSLAQAVLAANNNPQNHRQHKELNELVQQDRKESLAITQRLFYSRADVRSDSTRRDADSALRLYSRNHDACGMLGRCLAARGDYAGARKHLEQALTINPQAFFYRLILGQVLEELGQWKAAEREYHSFNAHTDRNERGKEGLRRVREHLHQEQRKKDLSSKGSEIVFINNKTGREEHHPVKLIRDFLYDRMRDWNLPIRDIIEQIGNEPVFIIAKTGVGKTVTVPTKVLLALCDNLLREGVDLAHRYPQVYVVEPRIPICTMTMAEMNEGYQNYVAYRMKDAPAFRTFLHGEGVIDIEAKDQNTVDRIVSLAHKFAAMRQAPYDPRHFNLYGCITSATGKINADAPILFVTTGIMESLTFEGTKLDPKFHRIIIDEAHVTIEANPAIELGIALARKRNIKIDYMSATVAPATLAADLGVKIVYAEAQRFPIHLTNLKTGVEESILGLVKDFLLDPDPSRYPDPSHFAEPAVSAKVARVRRHLLAQDDFEDDGKTYRGLKNRAQGMLVIVNSHQSENSDTHRIADLIARADFNRGTTRVHTLRLASPVVRDPAQKLAFDRLIKNIEDQAGRYVSRDALTPAGKQALTFIGLDDMDFARLLAGVIERYGVNSDMAVIVTVLAASSELSFNDLMAPRFFLTNPKQLSAMELFHEDALGVPVAEIFSIVAELENDAGQNHLHEALQARGVDDRLCSDICALVAAGYTLVASDSENALSDSSVSGEAGPAVHDSITEAQAAEADDLLEDPGTLADQDDEEIAESLRRDLDRFSTRHTLAFERAAVSFTDQTDLINIYRLYRYFFNNYYTHLKAGGLSALEASELRRSMDDEAGKLQVSARGLNELHNRFEQLSRHTGIQLVQEETRRSGDQPLAEDEKMLVCQSCIRELLFEREGTDARFDLCLRLFALTEDRANIQPRDYAALVAQLDACGFDTTQAEVKELWFLILRDARRKYADYLRQFEFAAARQILPPISKGLEKELLRIARESSYHTKLTFRRGDFGFTADVVDQFGSPITVTLPVENSPLATAVSGKDKVTVLTKLSPAMIGKSVRDELSPIGFSKREEKGFRLSHLTILG